MSSDTPARGLPSSSGSLYDRWRRPPLVAALGRSCVSIPDVAVLLFLFIFGELQFLSCERSVDFLREDVAFFELGKALLAGHGYAYNGVAESVQPPGLSLLLAALMRTLGSSHSLLVASVGAFLMLGLLASYWLLRRRYGRVAAAVSCIAVICSPSIFAFATRSIVPAFPYFLASVLALLAAGNLERASTRARSILWQIVLALSLAAAILLQVSGVALLAGIAVWLFFSAIRSRAGLWPRLRKFLPALAVGAVVFLAWMQQSRHQTKDWPIQGYPGGYLSQVVLKSGNQPELGLAGPLDLVVRLARNGEHYMDLFVGVFTSHWLDLTWSALVPATLLVLMLIGFLDAIFRRGSRPYDWYTLAYAAIYLFWSWQPELRFLIPVIPFLCVYIYAGAVRLPRIAAERPRLVGAVGVPLFSLLATDALYLGLQRQEGGLQLRLSAAIWIISASISLWMIIESASPIARIADFFRSGPGRRWTLGLAPDVALKAVGVTLLLAHASLGFASDLHVRDQNVNAPAQQSSMRADIDAATWISAHVPQGAVIMARHVPITFHYAQRHVVWFPPLSSPQVLMDGIRRLGVTHVMVVRRSYYYYLPPDIDCFNSLRRAYPSSFTLAGQGPDFQVFAVQPAPSSGVLTGLAPSLPKAAN